MDRYCIILECLTVGANVRKLQEKHCINIILVLISPVSVVQRLSRRALISALASRISYDNTVVFFGLLSSGAGPALLLRQ